MFLPLLLAAGALLVFISRQPSHSTVTSGPVTLVAGARYRIAVRMAIPLNLTRADALATARTSLASAGATDITMSTAAGFIDAAYTILQPKTTSLTVGTDSNGGRVLSVTLLTAPP